MDTRHLKHILTTGDKIVIGVLLLISLAGFPLVRAMMKAGNLVRIEAEGALYKILSLHEAQTLSVPGPLGDTLVVIHDGEVHVSESPCRHKICIKSGHISLAGELIACVPNKVVLRIVGDEKADYDAVTQ
ncbi:MAG: NusG domain II-containing protein [bacterium]|nr:NusG domain II-containing protein [bacterium]